MDQICPQFVHVFLVNLGVILNNIFAEAFYVMYAGGGVKYVYGNKKKTVFNFFVFCPLQSVCLPILIISLQVNFYQIYFVLMIFFKEEGL